MKAWIVVESMFGNTREIAEQIASGLRTRMAVQILNVAEAPEVLPDEVSMLVVGGPTHAFGMSRESTRESAVELGSATRTEIGIREWLNGVVSVKPGLPALAFDTRVQKRFVPGSAARAATRRLQKLGCTVVEAPISFFVEDMVGPLGALEAQRALEFGTLIVLDLDRRGLLPQSA